MLDRYWITDDRMSIRLDEHLKAYLTVRHAPIPGLDPYLWTVTVAGVGTTSSRSWTAHRAKLAATRAYLTLTGQERKLGRPRKTA